MARRLLVERVPAAAGEIELLGEAAHHLRVLRLQPGAALVLFDGSGMEADAELLDLHAQGARLRVARPRVCAPLGEALVLLVGLTRGSTLDDVVRACTEIGVRELRAVICARSQVHAEPSERRQERLGRIAREAARQCGRPDVPSVLAPEPLLRAAARAPGSAAKLALHPGAQRSLSERALGLGAASAVWAVVGPEGGLTADEQRALGDIGYEACGLGPTTLRVETAATVVAALVCAGLRAAASR